MREILFRGKTLNNEWVQGAYYHQTEFYGDDFAGHYFITTTDELEDNMMNVCMVIPKTVGQYTGLTDKNGKKIFEGDIVVVNIKGYNTICKVDWADNVAQFQLWQTNTISHTPTALNLGNYDCEVIGNIHDNKLEDFQNGC